MATVYLTGELSQIAGGIEAVTLDAARVIDLRRALESRFPGIDASITDLAVAIDGEIYNDADYQPLKPSSDVHFVPRVAGG